ncbi:hypothetical protein CTAYLR_004960 [Chrysophaeum taylorii]|uniref:Protein ENHANCED DISEASE RESISTANCE 2 C-terminal domain-containing protein n=1 Tax=Chrysophaeum taylorii TaxID=2483200 RepID=A0AAD7URG0_9STRA|nr:hypothetical protein CTAYLR_004960 [Chrysophaeum taylorii]
MEAAEDATSPTTAGTKGLKVILRRHVDKLKQRKLRSPRSPDSDDEAVPGRRYERLERAVKRQLNRGRAARRKFQQLRHRRRRRTDGYSSAVEEEEEEEEEEEDLEEEDEEPPKDEFVDDPQEAVVFRDDNVRALYLPLVREALGEAMSEVQWAVLAMVSTAACAFDASRVLLVAALAFQALALRRRVHGVAATAIGLATGEIIKAPKLEQDDDDDDDVSNKSPLIRKKKTTTVPHWEVPSGAGSNSWSPVASERFSLRGAKYLQDRAKAPSGPALYEPEAVHIFQSRGGSMARVVESRPELLPSDHNEESSSSTLPRFLVFNMSVPTEAPSMRGWWPGNPCWTIVVVFKLVSETAASPAVRLFERWLESCNEDPATNSRLKGVFFCRGSSDDEPNKDVPRLLQKWNGKPVLMAENPSGFSRARKGISKVHVAANYAEVAINVGESFSYMGRAAVYIMIGKLGALECDVGFTLEGRAADELPETLLGAITFSKLRLADRFKTLQPPSVT